MTSRRRSFVRMAIALFIGAGAVLVAPSTRGDRISLSGGSELRGVVLKDPARPNVVLVQTETGERPIVFPKDGVVKVVAEDDPLDDYFARRDKVAATAQAQFDFATWCEGKGLKGLALQHHRKAAELDPSFGPAQKKLGRVEHNGVWMTYDQLHEVQGMVKVKGRWVSRQEQERAQAKDQDKADQTSWSRRIAILRRRLLTGKAEERADAEERLRAIRDRSAVRPLVQSLGTGEPAERALVAQILGEITGSEARTALVQRVLSEDDAVVRRATLDQLLRRREAETTGEFVSALRDPNAEVAGRAAWALAGMGAKTAVPKMIAQLVRYQKRRVMVPTGASPNAISAGSSTLVEQSNQAGTALGLRGGSGIGQAVGSSGVDGFYQGYTVPYVSANVAPGAVAFGAGPASFGTGVGLSTGGNGPAAVPRVVVVPVPNPDVLAALEDLTGQTFGFDVAAWRRWLNTGFRVEPAAPVRRAPEP